MAVGDIKYNNGVPVKILSSGETPTIYWQDGKPVVIHEYVASGGETVIPVIHYYRQLMS